MAQLPTLEEGGVITAAVASQISDGAVALMVASERAVKEHGFKTEGSYPSHKCPWR